jgi:hypothetical protein
MRKSCILALAPALYITVSNAQSMNGPPVLPRDLSAYQNIVNINGQDGFYLKKDLYLRDSYTIINGQKVMGIPFLFLEWYGGSITTADGRVYNDYKLKYNAENQTVHFLNGSDSLEVNEELREFSLRVPRTDTLITARFINSSQYHRGETIYYEVLLETETGQLLKTNQKLVANADQTIMGTRKYLKLESNYFYFDKKTKKLSKIKAFGNIDSILNLTPEESKELQIQSIEVSDESQLQAVFKKYFEKKKAY